MPFRWIAPEPRLTNALRPSKPFAPVGGHAVRVHRHSAAMAPSHQPQQLRGVDIEAFPRSDLRLFSSVLLSFGILYDDAAAIRTRNNELPAERARGRSSSPPTGRSWQKGETWTPLS